VRPRPARAGRPCRLGGLRPLADDRRAPAGRPGGRLPPPLRRARPRF
jgi:hypothetical protein